MDFFCLSLFNYELIVNYDIIIYVCVIMGGIVIFIIIFVIGVLYGIFKRCKKGID